MRKIVAAVTLLVAGCIPAAGQKVTAEEYGEDWPFSVAEGRVDCRPSGALVFVADGTSYALTGHAKTRGYTPVDGIWIDSSAIPGTKVSLTSITNAAKALCD